MPGVSITTLVSRNSAAQGASRACEPFHVPGSKCSLEKGEKGTVWFFEIAAVSNQKAEGTEFPSLKSNGGPHRAAVFVCNDPLDSYLLNVRQNDFNILRTWRPLRQCASQRVGVRTFDVAINRGHYT